MDSLFIDNGLKQVKVNKEEEYIEFSISDSKFLKSFSNLIQWLELQKKNAKDIEEQRQKVSDGENVNYEALDNYLELCEKISKECCEKIDAIFGAEASRKVFGNITPDIIMIGNFLERISTLIEKYAKERNQTINREYSKNRKGAKS